MKVAVVACMAMETELTIIGAGLAGCEAALMAARLGVMVELWEMKPRHLTPAHNSPLLGELVCSNSLRSADPTSAVGLLKLEMSLMGSAVTRAAEATRVPAGKALAVDRERFAAVLDQAVRDEPCITIVNRRVERLPEHGPVILATGPLTDGPLAAELARLAGTDHLHFYDAIAPIVTAESVDMDHAFWADRYSDAPGDYLNCPLSQQEYAAFYAALTTAEQVPLRDFEKPKFFEGCLPIEVMAGRGEKTLLFGPMKPVGLTDPRTGQRPFAALQLRKEDAAGRLLNMVGFQTKLTHRAQLEVFRLIPALAHAEFVRLGSIHRNSFIDAPRVLRPDLRLKTAENILVAGQLSGVEGYVESSASGMLCGWLAAMGLLGQSPALPPPTTAMGALVHHLQDTASKHFQPMNVNFGLFSALEKRYPKKQRGRQYAKRALNDFLSWLESVGLTPAHRPPEL